MPEWLDKLLTEYGPLGMGWPLLYYVWSHWQAREVYWQGKCDALVQQQADAYKETIEGNTVMINGLRLTIEELKPPVVRAVAPRRGVGR